MQLTQSAILFQLLLLTLRFREYLVYMETHASTKCNCATGNI